MGSLLLNVERIIRQFRVRQCPVPFVIFTMERTGSSYFCSLLDSHPEVVCRREDFHEIIVREKSLLPGGVEPLRVTSEGSYFRQIAQFGRAKTIAPTSKQAIAHLYDIFSCPVTACGFKFKFPIQYKLFPEVIDELQSVGKKLRVISLARRNFIKQAVSRQNMLRIRTVTEGAECNLSGRISPTTKREIVGTSFRIDVEKVIQYAKQLQEHHARFQENVRRFGEMSGREVLEIDYQDLLDDYDETIKSTLRFLQVDQEVELVSRMDKATSDRLSEAVENYDELADAVQGTDFAAFLDE